MRKQREIVDKFILSTQDRVCTFNTLLSAIISFYHQKSFPNLKYLKTFALLFKSIFVMWRHGLQKWSTLTCPAKSSAGRITWRVNAGLSGIILDVWPPYLGI